MPSLKAKLKGLPGLERKMKRYRREAKKNVSEAIEATAILVRDDAKEGAPFEFGNLRNSIKKRVEVAELYGRVFTNMEYARRQELGFHDTDKLGRTYDQAGFFYMTKAANKHRKGHKKRVKEAIRNSRP